MKNLLRKLSYTLYFVLAVVSLTSCHSVPTQLNGKILHDDEGNTYKLEWKNKDSGWRFLYPVTIITQQKDTLIEWRYYR